jgi:DNA-binding XRE family transcriptional regulator
MKQINALHKIHNFICRIKSIIYNANMLFEIGKQIRRARKTRHLTQAELSKALGMTRTTIGQIENDTVQEIGGA